MIRTHDKFTKARAQLIMMAPFFGNLALRLRAIKTTEVETAATDGRFLWWNPDFIESLSMPQVRGLIAHEIMHCVLQHHVRRGNRDAERWNVAGDLAANYLLRQGDFELPEGALADAQFDNLPTETIYARLPEQEGDDSDDGDDGEGDGAGGAGAGGSGEQGGESDDDGSDDGSDGEGDSTRPPAAARVADPGRCGVVIDARDEEGNRASGRDLDEHANGWKMAVAQAAQAAEGADKLPAFVKEIVDGILEPVVDWPEKVRDFMTHPARCDFTWTRGNRNLLHTGLYLPGLGGVELGPVVVAVDASGSVPPTMLQQFAGEINAIMDETKPSRVHVVYFHSTVFRVDEFDADDLPFTLEKLERGGTCFAPIFEAVDEMPEPPACLICLTDMGAFDWDALEDPGYPVMWADFNAGQWAPADLPFGEHVVVEEL